MSIQGYRCIGGPFDGLMKSCKPGCHSFRVAFLSKVSLVPCKRSAALDPIPSGKYVLGVHEIYGVAWEWRG